MAHLDPALIAQIDDLNRQHNAKPHDPDIARRWCSLALRLGQLDKVKRCAAQFYAYETDPLRLAEWSLLGGQVSFHLLKLEDTLAAFTISLMHLCEISNSGRMPAPKPRPKKENLFANGAAEELLWTTNAALAHAGFKTFPFAGTLLGLVREGRLLTADKDIDLGVWSEDFDACCHWLETQDWVPLRSLPPYKTFRAFLHPSTKLTLDIAGIESLPAERKMVGGFQLEGYPPQYQSIRKFPWFDLETRPSPAGESWFIKEPENILTALYGDWRTPNPWWDGMVSDLCATEFTLLTRCYAYDRLLSRWTTGQLERAWAYAHQILLQDTTDLPAIRAKKSLEAVLRKINPQALNWPPTSTRSVLR